MPPPILQNVAKPSTGKRALTLLTTAMLAVILFFGLRPNTWPNINRVTWTPEAVGLMFHAPGFAYVDNLSALLDREPDQEFAICFGASSVKQLPGFRPILMFHNGSDNKQLTIAQWGTSVIVMNGDDYSYRRKLPRISSESILDNDEPHFIGITSGINGTRLFDNGTLVAEKQDVVLRIPTDARKLQLVVGNSVYGNHSWEGTLYRLAFYDRQLTPAEMMTHCHGIADQHSTAAEVPDMHRLLLFTFDEGQGTTVHDRSGNHQPLLLPARPMALKQTFLAPPWSDFYLSKTFVKDMVVNVLGFIPLGAVLYMRLRLSSTPFGRYPACITILLCGGISLVIELAQGWLPNRSSSQLDLILNTFGAGLGVFMVHIVWARISGFLSPPSNQAPTSDQQS